MIQNSAEINFGGLRIVAIHSNDDPNYEISVTTTATIFSGSPAEFEAMCESHRLLKDACDELINTINCTRSDINQINNALLKAKEALRRAE